MVPRNSVRDALAVRVRRGKAPGYFEVIAYGGIWGSHHLHTATRKS